MDNSTIEAGIRWYGNLLDIFTLAVVMGLFFEYRNDAKGFRRFGSNGEIPNSAPPPFAPSYSSADDVVTILVGRNPTCESAFMIDAYRADTDDLLHLQTDGPAPYGWR
jgi:hypothetical protein